MLVRRFLVDSLVEGLLTAVLAVVCAATATSETPLMVCVY